MSATTVAAVQTLQVIGSWLGLPAIILALVNFGLRLSSDRTLENLRTANAAEVARLSSELGRIANEAKTRFDWLHTKRARSIIELYGLLVDLDMATAALVSPWMPGDQAAQEQEVKRRWEAVNKAGNAYRVTYPKASIFFEAPVVRDLRALDDLYWKKYVAVSVYGQYKTPGDMEQMIKAQDRSAVEARTAALRATLQRLLGVTAPDANGTPE